MPPNLLLLPLLGGYCLVHFCHYFRFRAQRSDGYRLLFESAIAGVCLSAISRILILLLKVLPLGLRSKQMWDELSPFPFSGTAMGALLLGFAIVLIANRVWNEEWAKGKVLERHGNALFRLLHEAAKSGKPISVTLDNRKWYMGYVWDSPNLDPQEQYFALIPILSGYRDSNTLQIRETVTYSTLQGPGVDKNDFAVTIPLASVKSASYFNKVLWEKLSVPRSRRKRN